MQTDNQQPQSSQPQAQPQADLKTRKLNLLYQAHKQVMDEQQHPQPIFLRVIP